MLRLCVRRFGTQFKQHRPNIEPGQFTTLKEAEAAARAAGQVIPENPSVMQHLWIPCFATLAGCGGLYFLSQSIRKYRGSKPGWAEMRSLDQANKPDEQAQELFGLGDKSKGSSSLLSALDANILEVSSSSSALYSWMDMCSRCLRLTWIFSTVILWIPIITTMTMIRSIFGYHSYDYDPEHPDHHHHHQLGYATRLFRWWLGKCADSMDASGCVWIKLGQWIAMRPDLFGPLICSSFISLTHEVRIHEFKESCNVICREFGVSNVDEVFEYLDEEPHSCSGAVAQVHFGVLNEDYFNKHFAQDSRLQSSNENNNQNHHRRRSGEQARKVAVKIRHPSINRSEIVMDLTILFRISYLMSMFSSLTIVPISVESFTSFMLSQIDLRHEAYAMLRFERNFIHSTNVKFPLIFPSLCTESIMVESWESSDPRNLKSTNKKKNDDDNPNAPYKHDKRHKRLLMEAIQSYQREQRESKQKQKTMMMMEEEENMEEEDEIEQGIPELKWVTETGIQLLSQMLWKDGLIHTDMHSANIIIDEQNQVLTLIDGGLTADMSAFHRQQFGTFFLDALIGNSQSVARLFLSFDPRFGDLAHELVSCSNTNHRTNNHNDNNNDLVFLNNQIGYPKLSRLAKNLENDVKEVLNEIGVYRDVRIKWLKDSKKRLPHESPLPFPYDVSGLMNGLIQVLQKNGIAIDKEFASMMLSIGICEGIAKQIEPDTDIVSRCVWYFAEFEGDKVMKDKMDQFGGSNALFSIFAIDA